MSFIEAVPFYADNISSIHSTFTDATNISTLAITPTSLAINDNLNVMYLNISSINFSDENGTSGFTTTSLNLNTLTSTLSLSGVDSSYSLTVGSGATLDLNVSKVLLSGVDAPAVGGQNLIAQGANGLEWFSITDLLRLEAGIYVNNNNVSTRIKFNTTYMKPPAVVITPDADSSGIIVPVSLNGVTTTGFNAIFGSHKLSRFTFIVLPVNSQYSINVSDNVSVVSTINYDPVG